MARVALAALTARGLCLVFYISASSGADVRGYKEFLALEDGQTTANRLEALQEESSERLAPFDGQFYIDIARRGYRSFKEWPGGNFAFFPLYPVFIALLQVMGGPTMLVSALVQLLLCAGASVFVWIIAEHLGTPPWIPVALLLAWPAGVFQVLMYSESLYLFLSTLAFFLNLRGREGFAAAAGFLAGLTRPQGVLVSLLLLPPSSGSSRLTVSRRLSRLLFVSPLLGFLCYMLLLELSVGDAFAFLRIQEAWGRSASPFAVGGAIIRVVTLDGLLPDTLTALGGLLLIPVFWRSLPLPMALFAVGSILMPLATGTSLSMCRFVSVAFPVFLALGHVLRKRPAVVAALVLMGAILQVSYIQRLASWEFAG